MEKQTNSLMLRTVDKIQNDVGMTKQFPCLAIILPKYVKKFDEKTSFSSKMV